MKTGVLLVGGLALAGWGAVQWASAGFAVAFPRYGVWPPRAGWEYLWVVATGLAIAAYAVFELGLEPQSHARRDRGESSSWFGRPRLRNTDDAPSRRFLRWVRGTILLMWAVLLLIGAPRYVDRGNGILRSQAPGPSRNAALRDLAVEGAVVLVTMPGLVLAGFGYGVFFRRYSTLGGEPYFIAWRKGKRPRSSEKKN